MRMEREQPSKVPCSSIATAGPALDRSSHGQPPLQVSSVGSFPTPREVISVITPILQMKRAGLKGANSLTQDPPRAVLRFGIDRAEGELG